MKKRNLNITKKTSEVKSNVLPEGNNNIYITKNQKLETKTNCNSSYQKHHLPTKRQQKTSIAILYLCYLRTARHKM